jgi:ribosome-associated protein
MLQLTDKISIPENELHWTFVRSGGPGGQNVNKVASKAVLRWDMAANATVPDDVKSRLRTLHRRRITNDGELVLSSQRYRDQERNRQDCLDKLSEMLGQASVRPTARRPTKPTRGSRERRLHTKRHWAFTKAGRRPPPED